MRVNVLTPGFTTSNGSALLFPLVVHKNALRNGSIEIRLMKRSAPDLAECDVLAIDSKEFRSEWTDDRRSQTLDLLLSYREAAPRVVWFDTTDSTGTIQSQVFVAVDKYLKSQLLVDRNRYTEQVYSGRIYSEFYNKTAGVEDDPASAIDEPISPGDTEKLGVSWNAGLSDYSTFGPWKINLYNRISLPPLLRHPGAIESPGSRRPNDLSARFGATYSKPTVRYQREEIRKLLSDRLDTQKLNRRGYMKELRQSKVVLSPFGWGEITLKDFEVFLSGSMLLKPSVDHMQTWPHFYEAGVTYLSHKWDLTDLEQQIEWAISNTAERLSIADEGQRRYIQHTAGADAAELFVTHLSEVLSK